MDGSLPIKPGDTGPIYTETDLSRFIVEPYNAFSALLFVLLVVYWWWRLRGEYKSNLFLAAVLPILFIGGIGGTLYHAFRNSELFLVMDWLPILLLTLAACGYFFYRAVRSTWAWGLAMVLAFGLQWLNFQLSPAAAAINVSYVLTALMVLIPLLLLFRKTRFSGWHYVGYAFLSFGLAVFFRMVDPRGWLAMGTHLLWHLFGMFACHFMLLYIYRLPNQDERKQAGRGIERKASTG